MISVIVPVYNTSLYLQECIDCLLAQTMEDMELIFVDDASSDGSLELLKKNEKKHPDKIRVIASEENRHQGGARNLGILAASGEYIGFIDSDDLASPDMFELLYRAITEYDVTASFVWMKEVTANADLPALITAREGWKSPEWAATARSISDHLLSKEEKTELMILPVGGSVTWLYRREFLLENELFFPEGVSYEDNYWGPIVKAQLHSVHFVDSCCYFYRRNGSSTTQRRNNPGVYDRITLEDRMIGEFRRRSQYEAFQTVLEYGYTERRTFMTYGFFLHTYDKPPLNVMRELMRSLKEQFPDWEKNPIYQAQSTAKERLNNRIKYMFPGSYCRLRRLLQFGRSRGLRRRKGS